MGDTYDLVTHKDLDAPAVLGRVEGQDALEARLQVRHDGRDHGLVRGLQHRRHLRASVRGMPSSTTRATYISFVCVCACVVAQAENYLGLFSDNLFEEFEEGLDEVLVAAFFHILRVHLRAVGNICVPPVLVHLWLCGSVLALYL